MTISSCTYLALCTEKVKFLEADNIRPTSLEVTSNSILIRNIPINPTLVSEPKHITDEVHSRPD